MVNDVGQWVWEHLDGRHSTDDLVVEACQEFAVEPDRARADVELFLRDAQEAGLVEVAAPGD